MLILTWNRSPIASFNNFAATVLSTPPDTAPICDVISKLICRWTRRKHIQLVRYRQPVSESERFPSLRSCPFSSPPGHRKSWERSWQECPHPARCARSQGEIGCLPIILISKLWHVFQEDAHTEDRQRLVGNASKLAVLRGGNGLKAVG